MSGRRRPRESPPGDLVLRADPGWAPDRLRDVRGRLWLLGVLVVPGAIGSVVRRDPGPLLGSFVLVAVAVVLGALLLALALTHGWATLTLTETHLVLRRPGRRRRRVRRDDVSALVLGWFTELPGQTSGGQLVVVDRDGRRWVTLPGAAWRRADVERLAAGLGVEARAADDRRDRALTPWWVRHRNRAAAAVVVALLALVLGAAGVAAVLQTRGTAEAARGVDDAFAWWAARLQDDPRLESVTTETRRDDDGTVGVVVEAVATSSTGEAEPALVDSTFAGACAEATRLSAALDVAVPTEVDLDTALVDRPLLDDGGRVERRVRLSCEDGSAVSDPVLTWLAHVAAHPFGAGVVRVSVEAGAPDTLDVVVSVASPADVDAAVAVACARGAGTDPGAAAQVLVTFSSPDVDTRVLCAEQGSP